MSPEENKDRNEYEVEPGPDATGNATGSAALPVSWVVAVLLQRPLCEGGPALPRAQPAETLPTSSCAWDSFRFGIHALGNLLTEGNIDSAGGNIQKSRVDSYPICAEWHYGAER